MNIEPTGYEVKPYGDYIVHFQNDKGGRYEWNVSTAPDRLLLKDKVISILRRMSKGYREINSVA